MLRWMTPFLIATFAAGTAAAQTPEAPPSTDSPAAAKPAEPPAAAKPADEPAAAKPTDTPAAAKPANSPAAAKRAAKAAAGRRAAVRAATQLPPGLPRAHYNYRTTVAPAPRYVRRGRALVVVEEEGPEELLAPAGIIKAYAPRFNTPLLPGSSTLPGYYGTSHSYSYDGPYYGGPYEPYWNRLPYACGVYGYC